ncbi:hypothetical protein SDC9_149196 [bioreactor metagenome]|uniref:Uncharacterized protein n=1 Tax=bioreactor metagenome TaxID=1076179 RepID=A0A645EN63_9ZZZZ
MGCRKGHESCFGVIAPVCHAAEIAGLVDMPDDNGVQVLAILWNIGDAYDDGGIGVVPVELLPVHRQRKLKERSVADGGFNVLRQGALVALPDGERCRTPIFRYAREHIRQERNAAVAGLHRQGSLRVRRRQFLGLYADRIGVDTRD